MPAPNPVVVLIREWLAKAENDLLNAAHTLTLGAACPTDTVCFHAQQCVEKHIISAPARRARAVAGPAEGTTGRVLP